MKKKDVKLEGGLQPIPIEDLEPLIDLITDLMAEEYVEELMEEMKKSESDE